MKRFTLPVLTLACAVGLGACTHTMRVRNLNEYAKTATADRPLTIVLEDRSASDDERAYFTFVQEALATHPAVRSVVLESQQPVDVVPDARVAVHPQAAYHGSWWNYPITFPGFVLFTHAWNGYVYRADLDTEITVDGGDHAPTTQSVATRYRMRHCNFKRGALASSGWYTPGWGGLNAVIGFFMIPYDRGSTPAFQKEIRSAYGSYIANSIVDMVRGTESVRGRGQPEAARSPDLELAAPCA